MELKNERQKKKANFFFISSTNQMIKNKVKYKALYRLQIIWRLHNISLIAMDTMDSINGHLRGGFALSPYFVLNIYSVSIHSKH